jgi:hypothetical protein
MRDIEAASDPYDGVPADVQSHRVASLNAAATEYAADLEKNVATARKYASERNVSYSLKNLLSEWADREEQAGFNSRNPDPQMKALKSKIIRAIATAGEGIDRANAADTRAEANDILHDVLACVIDELC